MARNITSLDHAIRIHDGIWRNRVIEKTFNFVSPLHGKIRDHRRAISRDLREEISPSVDVTSLVSRRFMSSAQVIASISFFVIANLPPSFEFENPF